jgi:hypothetical protein
VGDVMVRTALFEAATVMLAPTRSTKNSQLKSWALDVLQRRGIKRAIRPRAQARRGAAPDVGRSDGIPPCEGGSCCAGANHSEIAPVTEA